MEYWTAFTIGLVGSFHCIGMCGPIAFAIPLPHPSWFNRILGSLIYNLGRINTYAIFGTIFGLIGKGFAFAGFQQWASIFLGIRKRPLLSNSTVTTPDRKLRCNFRYSSLNSFNPEIFENTFLNSTMGYNMRHCSKPRRITSSLPPASGS